jgi:DnaK suppressor protein
MFKERVMPARKPLPKSGKAKKPVAAKSAAKRTVVPRKPVAKAAPPPRPAATKAKVPLKTAAKSLDKKPSVTATPKRPEAKKRAPAPALADIAQIEAPDDNEADSNLLSGPRNVQPYVARRGEQYMSKEQLNHFRQILASWKQDLMMEVDRTVSHMKDEAANFPDPNDRATQEEEFSLELRTRDRERKLIRKIEEAIKRTEDGSYGYCLETGEQIGIKRLEARPVATLSIEAQERRERREKQYGDRDDRYR